MEAHDFLLDPQESLLFDHCDEFVKTEETQTDEDCTH